MLKLNTLSGFGSGAAGGGAGGAGYVLGGVTVGKADTTEKMTYADFTFALVATADLSEGRATLVGCSNASTHGYSCGGNAVSDSTCVIADKTTFADDVTAAATTANFTLHGGRQVTAVTTNATAGYFSGGAVGGTVDTTEKVTYADDIMAAASTADLTTGAAEGQTGGSGVLHGYIVRFTLADKLVFATDTTAAATTADLPANVAFSVIGVGDGGTNVWFWKASDNIAYKIVVATDTDATVATADLSVVRRTQGSSFNQSNTNGWCCGGNTGARTTSCDQLVYATETTTVSTAAVLSTGRSENSAFGSDAHN